MTVAGDLVRAFGDVEHMNTMYSDDIVWTLPASLGPTAGPHHGRDAVLAFNNAVWGQYYSPVGVEVDILTELQDGEVSAVRFVYRATVLATGETYENTYTLFALSRGGQIVDVKEDLDTLKLLQYAGLRDGLPPQPT